jgi:S-DNA-T family DNA segregation ATPase FtsK/SpoIIIE
VARTQGEGRKAASNSGRRRVWRESLILLVVPVLLYLLACLASYSPDDPGWSHSGSVTGEMRNFGGVAGAWFADVTLSFFGIAAYTLPVLLGLLIWAALRGRDGDDETAITPALRLIGVVAFLVAASGLAHLHHAHLGTELPAGSGGLLGGLVGGLLLRGFGFLGSTLFVLALLLVAITLATGLSWFALMDRIGRFVLSLGGLMGRGAVQANEWRQARAAKAEREEVRREDTIKRAKREPVKIEPQLPPPEKSERAQREQQIPLFAVSAAPGGDGSLPPLSLLDEPKPQPKGYSEEALETLSRQIEFKLKDFRIEAQVQGVYPGPVITRFEMEPAPGVKGSQISNLDKDIARGLSVKSVRVVDVIPGKSVIGWRSRTRTARRSISRKSCARKSTTRCRRRWRWPSARTSAADPAWSTWRGCRTFWWPAPPARASRWRSTRWC